jgi:hypothetical protein
MRNHRLVEKDRSHLLMWLLFTTLRTSVDIACFWFDNGYANIISVHAKEETVRRSAVLCGLFLPLHQSSEFLDPPF